MIISKNWLKDHIDIDLDDITIESSLTALGLECTIKKDDVSYKDVYIGKIINLSKHQNADKLSVCDVDIGNDKKLNIVCGAPNVIKNANVAVAVVGSSLNKGDFLIKKTKIRGVFSEGMLCSEKELDLSSKDDGIMILPEDCKIGTKLEDHFNTQNDTIFELDLTPNRGDCLSHLGVARELASLNNFKIKKTETSFNKDFEFDKDCTINISNIETCYRYSSRIIKGIKVEESPQWLKKKLTSIGQKSINNIVDAANYIMFDTGHPLHTFDLSKLNGNCINVRYAEKNEKITLLDDKTYDLNTSNLVIADDKKPIALAGVMGDNKSGISVSTVDLLIESAYFKPQIIRKSAKSLGLMTESSKRFERDTDIESLTRNLDKFIDLINTICKPKSISDLKDLYLKKKDNVIVDFNILKCNLFLGTSIKAKEANNIFKKLNIKLEKNNRYKIPSYRNDLTRDVDLYEEIARIFGYDNIPSNNTFNANYSSFDNDDLSLIKKIKFYLMSNGFYEHYSNSLVDQNNDTIFSDFSQVKISNPLSNKMQYLRSTLIPGLISAISFNLNRKQENFKLFESGVIHKYVKNVETKSIEKQSITLAFVPGEVKHWKKNNSIDFYTVKGEIIKFLKYLRFDKITFKDKKNKGFLYSFSINVNNVPIGYWGEVDNSLIKHYKIKNKIYFADFSYEKLNGLQNDKINFLVPNVYPSISRDIAIEVDSQVESETIQKTIISKAGNLLKSVFLFDVYQDKKMGDSKKSLAYKITFQSNKRTLLDNEIDDKMRIIMKSLKDIFNIKQR
ncbi:MAG: phenylalanine--tRNA ligase subunit beta [Candidatus Marinimicrobia bacterium]|nr:phenylalanine--tRNA ligase subunit beta [Candidatus Neomarinimicrobiota bacterium]